MASLEDKVDELLAGWDKPDSPGGVLAVISNGEIVYKRGYGMADLERDVPLTADFVFDLASTGKQFTAMLIAILAGRGQLSLDDDIRRYLPELPSYGHSITLRHLLHHTSGLREYTTLMYLAGLQLENHYSEQELLELITRQKALNFPPGEEVLYSNTGYVLLGIIAQRITGRSLVELIEQQILAPLGMRQSTGNDDFKRLVKHRAVGYSPADGGYRVEVFLGGGFGDGAILSTVEDLLRWDRNFYHNTLGGGGQALIQQMLTLGVLNSGQTFNYAWGLMVTRYRGLPVVSHGGGWGGYRAELMRFPEQRFSVICLANLSSIEPTRLAKQVADLYLAAAFTEPGPPPAGTDSIVLPPEQLESKTGFYRNLKSGAIWEIFIQDGKLMVDASDLISPMAATSPTHFRAVDAPFEVEIEFKTDPPEAAGHPVMSVRIKRGEPELFHWLGKAPFLPEGLSDYAGRYCCEELAATHAIRFRNGQLLLRRGKAAGEEALQPVLKDLFISRQLDLQFVRDERNRVYAFHLGAGRVRDFLFLRQPVTDGPHSGPYSGAPGPRFGYPTGHLG